MSISIDPGGYNCNISADWFFNPKAGDRGRLASTHVVDAKKQSDINDYILPENLDPIKYLQLVMKKDMASLVNFGIENRKQSQEQAEDKNKKKSPPPQKPTKKDDKEKDV